jgi:hypothetical protein
MARNEQDRVITSNSPDHFRQLGPIDSRREWLCLTRLRTKNQQLLHLFDTSQVINHCSPNDHIRSRPSTNRLPRTFVSTIRRALN